MRAHNFRDENISNIEEDLSKSQEIISKKNNRQDFIDNNFSSEQKTSTTRKTTFILPNDSFENNSINMNPKLEIQKHFLDQWKFRKRWLNFSSLLIRKRRIKTLLSYQKSLFSQKNEKIRQNWQKLSKNLVRRQQFTYLLVDLINLYKYRKMKKHFHIWIQKYSQSKQFLRIKWQTLMRKKLHRDVMLRIYNVESENHTRTIWFEFIDGILHKYRMDQLRDIKDVYDMEKMWILLAQKIRHNSIMRELYRVKSILKTKVVWKYFRSYLLKKYNLTRFRWFIKQDKLLTNQKIKIITNWYNIVHNMNLHISKQRIDRIRQFLALRRKWRYFMKELMFNRFTNLLSSGKQIIHERNENIKMRAILRNAFKQWFCLTLADKQINIIYENALSIFTPTFLNQSAAVIQKIFRLHLKHQKRIYEMIFNQINIDTFTKNHVQSKLSFPVPKKFPPKIYNKLVLFLSNQEAALQAQHRPEISFNINKLTSFSFEKDFPTPQMEMIIEDLDYSDFNYDIQISMKEFKKETPPKFSDEQIYVDVIQYVEVEPIFSITFPKFYILYSNNEELIENVLDIETNLNFEEEFTEWLTFSNIIINTTPQMNVLNIPKEPVPSDIKFAVSNIISTEISDEMYRNISNKSYVDDDILNVKQIGDFLDKIGPIIYIDQDEYDHIFDHNELFYLDNVDFLNPLNSCDISNDINSNINLLSFQEIKESVFIGINNINIVEIDDVIIDLDTSAIDINLSLFTYDKSMTLVEILYQPQSSYFTNFLILFRDDQKFHELNLICLKIYKPLFSVFMNIPEQQRKQVSELRFDNNELYSSTSDILFSREYFIKGFYFSPKSSCFMLADRMIEESRPNDFIYSVDIDSVFSDIQIDLLSNLISLSFIFPISITIDSKIELFRRDLTGIASLEAHSLIDTTFNNDFVVIYLRIIEYFTHKRKGPSNESIQNMFLVSYIKLFEDFMSTSNPYLEYLQFVDMNLLIRNIFLLNLCDFTIDFKPLDAIKLYSFNILQDPLISLYDLPIKIPYLDINSQDDRAFLDCTICDLLSQKIINDEINGIPIISNLPSYLTLMEIANDFLCSIPKYPKRFNSQISNLQRIRPKEPISFVTPKVVDDELNALFKEINFPIIPNTLNGKIDVDIEFDDLIEEIAGQFDATKLISLKQTEDKAMINKDILKSVLKLNEDSILNSLPIVPNSPQNSTLLEISEIFTGFPDLVESFATSYSVDNTLMIYKMMDDKMYFDEVVMCQVASRLLFDEIIDKQLPIVPNVPDQSDIEAIASDFYEFCDINTKVPLSPIKRIQRKDDRSFFTFDEAIDQFSSLLFQTELPIIPNSPKKETIHEIAIDFCDASDIICYFAGFDSLTNLLRLEKIEDKAFVNPFNIDRIAQMIFIYDIDLPLEANVPSNSSIHEIASEFYTTDIIDDLSEFKSLSNLLRLLKKEDISFVTPQEIDFISQMLFENDISLPIESNTPREKDLQKIADFFYSNDVLGYFVDFDSVTNLLRLERRDDKSFIYSQDPDLIAEYLFEHDMFLPLIPNTPSNDVLEEITSILLDSVDTIQIIPKQKLLLPLGSFERKDDRSFVNPTDIDAIAELLLTYVTNLPLVPNRYSNDVIYHIVSDIVPYDLIDNSFLRYLFNHYLNNSNVQYQRKPDLAFIDMNTIDNIVSALLDETIAYDNNLVPNVPSNNAINDIIDNLFDLKPDVFSQLRVSPVKKYNRKDDLAFIFTEDVDRFANEIMSFVVDELPISDNLPKSDDITQIIEDFYNVEYANDFSNITSSLTPFHSFTKKDDKSFYTFTESVKFARNLMLEIDFPLVLNQTDEKAYEEIVNFLTLNDVFHEPMFNLKSSLNFNYSFKDDRAFVSNDDVENIYYDIFFSVFDISPLMKNKPKFGTSREIVIGEYDSYDDVLSLFAKGNTLPLEVFIRKEDNAFINNQQIEYMMEYMMFSNMPLVPNRYDLDDVNKILNVISFDGVFDNMQFGLPIQFAKYEMKPDLAFLDNTRIDDIVYEMLCTNDLPLIKNMPTKYAITDIVDDLMQCIEIRKENIDLSIVNRITDLRKKDAHIFFSNDSAETFAFHIFVNSSFPLTKNEVNIDELQAITDYFIPELNNSLMTLPSFSMPPYERIDDHGYEDSSFPDCFIAHELSLSEYLPIVPNYPSVKAINDVLDDFMDEIMNLNDEILPNNIIHHLHQYEKMDPKGCCTFEEIDMIALNLIPDLPVIENKPNILTLREIVGIFQLEDTLPNTTNTEYSCRALQQFEMKADEVFVTESCINDLTNDLFEKNIFPIVPNTPSDQIIDNILKNDGILYDFTIPISLTDNYSNDIDKLFILKNLPPEILVDDSVIDHASTYIFSEIDLPLIPNDVIPDDIDRILSIISAFNIDFIDDPMNIFHRIHPTERPINISNEFVDDLITYELCKIFNSSLPLTLNDVKYQTVLEIIDTDEFEMKMPWISSDYLLRLYNMDPINRRISLDDLVFDDQLYLVLQDTFDNLSIIKNDIDRKAPGDIVNILNGKLEVAFNFLPLPYLKPVSIMTQKEIPTKIDEEFYDNLMMKILNNDVLPFLPVTKYMIIKKEKPSANHQSHIDTTEAKVSISETEIYRNSFISEDGESSKEQIFAEDLVNKLLWNSALTELKLADHEEEEEIVENINSKNQILNNHNIPTQNNHEEEEEDDDKVLSEQTDSYDNNIDLSEKNDKIIKKDNIEEEEENSDFTFEAIPSEQFELTNASFLFNSSVSDIL
ncbi:hypothetical protein TRFO_32489 [Tritrichomonas foetus]|uniref:Uncharacterized protein n=1 Tax=Tritrichomonas foetus TaxID=1144522 RepID=A0A1J4JQM9_9EUKA|nr:hypothetical protein TRFO_32489 [Tritrichomonas foetus]|eukprot:OHT00720.1 hypothetical protein TRFO_32489 [Tritrichomonas foetus]